jgi:methylenetetrahydrofolate dehydrogenase (NADP+)/methenyltetrahydrofolate cyclohydrolase
MTAKVIDGRHLAEAVITKVKAQASSLTQRPTLSVILAGDDPASHIKVFKASLRKPRN